MLIEKNIVCIFCVLKLKVKTLPNRSVVSSCLRVCWTSRVFLFNRSCFTTKMLDAEKCCGMVVAGDDFCPLFAHNANTITWGGTHLSIVFRYIKTLTVDREVIESFYFLHTYSIHCHFMSSLGDLVAALWPFLSSWLSRKWWRKRIMSSHFICNVFTVYYTLYLSS